MTTKQGQYNALDPAYDNKFAAEIDAELRKIKAEEHQLKDEELHGRRVREMGILYAPDYLVNAGGIINCYWEKVGYSREAAMSGTEAIYDTTLNIFNLADAENIPTFRAANNLAEARIASIRNINASSY